MSPRIGVAAVCDYRSALRGRRCSAAGGVDSAIREELGSK